VEIRRLGLGDGVLLRDVRLRALQDAPYAFSSWVEREVAYTPEFWESRVAQSASGRDGAVFVAVENELCLGMAGGFFAGTERETATLWGMWVDPSARRRGLGRELAEALSAWARGCGARRLRLAVTDCDASRPAASLYRALGFVETGEHEELASNPSLVALVMLRPL
jgi:ribosomal protein S18 acetylase RimI-like enzyme